MRILALDLGQNTGWAIVQGGDVVSSGSVRFVGDRQTRAARFLVWLQNFEEQACDVWIYERPFVRGRDATRCLWGLAGIVEAVGPNCGAAVLDAELKTVKKFMTGSGAAEKAGMIDAVAQVIGAAPATDHEADAIAIGLYASENVTTED